MQRFSNTFFGRTSTDARFLSCLEDDGGFLASVEAPFINASCINIDGGRSVMYHH